MRPIHVVQPVYFAILSRDTLGDAYERECAALSLHPIDRGFGLMLAIREDLTRCTMIASDPSYIRELAAEWPDDRRVAVAGTGRFPIVGDDWVTLPKGSLIATVGKLVIIGPANYGLGPTMPVHALTYLNDGAPAGEGVLGYARGDQLDEWRRDLTADGWVVDDRLAVAPAYPSPGSEIPDQPGYVVGECEHRVAGSEWRAGFRTCERCPAQQPAAGQ